MRGRNNIGVGTRHYEGKNLYGEGTIQREGDHTYVCTYMYSTYVS